VAIPALSHQDAAIVQSLLEFARFFCFVHAGFGESPDVVLIRTADVPAVKELLSEYTVRSLADQKIPIPW
jgi:hypothetical protein